MTQRIQVVVECDPCQHEEPDNLVSAVSRSVTVDGITYDVDTCPLHGKQIDVLAEWLAEVAHNTSKTKSRKPSSERHANAPSRQAGEHPCPADGCEFVGNTRMSLTTHARHVHGITLGELEGSPIVGTCEDCSRGFTTKQGLAVHRWRTHGKRGSDAA